VTTPHSVKGHDRSTGIRGVSGAAAGLCLLVIVKGVVTTHALPESGQVTIGRAEACEVRIDDPSISRRHATLYFAAKPSGAQAPRRKPRPPALAIEDLGSANGTFLRGPRAVPPLIRPVRLAFDVDEDTDPPSRGAEDAAVRLLARQRTRIDVGDFIDLGAVLLVVWPASAERLSSKGLHARPGLLVRDEGMRRLHDIIARIAVGNISVILVGETGVGKKMLAESVHRLSPRANKRFLGLDCAALSATALESELFGHEKSKTGLLEAADGGTLFLDAVGDVPMSLQGKLLRAIEDREVQRPRGLRPRAIDVRFVAATHRDLEADVARGLFRQDLYFRLNGISLLVPPLRERPAELGELACGFAITAARAAGIPRSPAISPEAMSLLERHRWPGNIRELRHVIERAVLLAAGDTIGPEHLPDIGQAPDRMTAPHPPPAPPMLETEAHERQRIALALDRCAGNQTRAAKMLGISRRTLTHRLGQYELPRRRKR